MHVTRQLNQLYRSAAHGDKLDMASSSVVQQMTPGTAHYNDKINTDDMYEYKKTLKKVRQPPMHFKLPRQYIVNSCKCNGLVLLVDTTTNVLIPPTYTILPQEHILIFRN
ncbi:hypothetical protein MKX01_026888 [Papaver californicum]|nr:hypothetical protein MKX01_028132 [Papaver californicum]KAI3950968.1 hypothetical protein MKX01_026888 [Papaver californicum]